MQGDNSNTAEEQNNTNTEEQNNAMEEQEGTSIREPGEEAVNVIQEEDEVGDEDGATPVSKRIGKDSVHIKKRIHSESVTGSEVISKEKKGKDKDKEKGKGKGKGKETGKHKAKGKNAKKGKGDSESDSDGVPVSKRKKVEDWVKFCQRCLRRYVPTDVEAICAACETIPKGSQKGSSKLASVKKRRARLVDDLVDGSVLSLKDMCMKLIAANIDAVEAVRISFLLF